VLCRGGRIAFSVWAAPPESVGFAAVAVTTVPQIWRAASPEAPFEAVVKGTVRAAALLRGQTPEARAAIRQAVREATGAHARDGPIELSMPAVLAAAARP
jgi:hypothetical protein